MTDARTIIKELAMERHPEGGWFKETFRDIDTVDGRPASTAIFYLLEKGDRSHWHRVDAVEVWHFYAGAPLRLSLCTDEMTTLALTLGPDIAAGQTPQVVIPKNHWQSAEPVGEWALVGCTVAPGFRFEGFEMAPPDWTPG